MRMLNVLLVIGLLAAVSLACSFGGAAEPTPEVAVQTAPAATLPPPTPTSPAAVTEEVAPPSPAADAASEGVGGAPVASWSAGTMTLPKTAFTPQEPIIVTLKGDRPLSDSAWVGIVPADTPHGSASEADYHDVDWDYVSGLQEGTTELNAPGASGAYDVRLFDPDQEEGQQELASVSITVAPHDLSQFDIQVAKKVYYPEEEIVVSFSVPAGLPNTAWLGLIPSEVAHSSEAEADEYDVSWQYLDGQTVGQLSLWAPPEAGSYDVRLFDSDRADGTEIASITIQVEAVDAGQAALQLSKSTLAPGEAFEVDFIAPLGLPDSAWIGIIPSEVAHGSEEEADAYDIAYEYVSGQPAGTVTFNAPEEAGAYDVRMFDSDSNGSELTYVSFQVK
jgi:hypothetical protein